MKNCFNGRDLLLDPYWFPNLTDNQISTVLHLFTRGPDYVYAISKETEIRQPTLQNIVKQLEEFGLIYLKETTPGEKKRTRKVYSLTGSGFCLAVLLSLRWRRHHILTRGGAEAIIQGIAIYKDMFRRADFGGVSLILKNWESIMRATEAHLDPPNVEDHRASATVFHYRRLPRVLSVPKNDPRWVWHAALYQTCFNMFDSCYLDDVKYVPGELFDMLFLSYILEPDQREPSVFAARITYFCNILRTDAEMSEFLERWIGETVTNLTAICSAYQGAMISLGESK